MGWTVNYNSIQLLRGQNKSYIMDRLNLPILFDTLVYPKYYDNSPEQRIRELYLRECIQEGLKAIIHSPIKHNKYTATLLNGI